MVVSGSPTMLGPVAQESVVDSALLRSIFRPFKPAFLYTNCTQIAPARNVPHYFWVARLGAIARDAQDQLRMRALLCVSAPSVLRARAVPADFHERAAESFVT